MGPKAFQYLCWVVLSDMFEAHNAIATKPYSIRTFGWKSRDLDLDKNQFGGKLCGAATIVGRQQFGRPEDGFSLFTKAQSTRCREDGSRSSRANAFNN